MAIRLTESHLRKIIREEMSALAHRKSTVKKRTLKESPYDDDDNDDDYELYGDVAMVDVMVPVGGAAAARVGRQRRGDALSLLRMPGLNLPEDMRAAISSIVSQYGDLKFESEPAGAGEVKITFYSSIPRPVKTIAAVAKRAGLEVFEYSY